MKSIVEKHLKKHIRHLTLIDVCEEHDDESGIVWAEVEINGLRCEIVVYEDDVFKHHIAKLAGLGNGS